MFDKFRELAIFLKLGTHHADYRIIQQLAIKLHSSNVNILCPNSD